MTKRINQFTDKELAQLKMEWYERGKRQAQRELRQELAKTLGLYDMFQTVEEDYY